MGLGLVLARSCLRSTHRRMGNARLVRTAGGLTCTPDQRSSSLLNDVALDAGETRILRRLN